MPSMTEDFGRLAATIATLRTQRQEAPAKRRKEMHERGAAVRRNLASIQTARGRAAREQRREAAATYRALRQQVKAILTQLGRQRAVIAAQERAKAISFMRELTVGVAALRDSFSVEQTKRAADWQEQLGGYLHDRIGAIAAWRGTARHVPAKPAEPQDMGQGGKKRGSPTMTPATEHRAGGGTSE